MVSRKCGRQIADPIAGAGKVHQFVPLVGAEASGLRPPWLRSLALLRRLVVRGLGSFGRIAFLRGLGSFGRIVFLHELGSFGRMTFLHEMDSFCRIALLRE